jgi:hypothetical protein
MIDIFSLGHSTSELAERTTYQDKPKSAYTSYFGSGADVTRTHLAPNIFSQAVQYAGASQ